MRDRIMRELYYAAESTIDSACQVLAAMLADDDTAKVLHPEDPASFLRWAAQIRADISTDKMKLAKAVAHHGFLMNTHLGFALSSLAGNPSHGHSSFAVAEAFAAWLEVQTYDSLPRIADLGGQEAVCELIADKLIAGGFSMSGFNVNIPRETVVQVLTSVNAPALYSEVRCDLLYARLRAGKELHEDE